MSASEASRWNRHGYPLQTATKGSIPRRLTTPPAEAEEKLPSDQLSATAGSTRTNGLGPAHEEVDQEQGFAEGPRSRNPLIPPPEVEDKNSGVVSQERSGRPLQVYSSDSMWSRGSYPLQSPTRGSTTSRQPPPHLEEERPAAPAPAPAQPSQQKKAMTGTSSWSRSGYPLQSPRGGAQAKPPPPATTPLETSSDQQSEPPSHHFHEHQEVESVDNVWHRQLYPAQPSTNGSAAEHLPTSPRSEKLPEETHKPTPAQIQDHGSITDKTACMASTSISAAVINEVSYIASIAPIGD